MKKLDTFKVIALGTIQNFASAIGKTLMEYGMVCGVLKNRLIDEIDKQYAKDSGNEAEAARVDKGWGSVN